MTSIESLTLEVADTAGFRGFALSLTVSQPATVNGFIGAALDAGATPLKPAAKSFWGYGGVVQAPDGTIWKVATSAKRDTGPASRRFDEIVLLLGAADVAVTPSTAPDRTGSCSAAMPGLSPTRTGLCGRPHR